MLEIFQNFETMTGRFVPLVLIVSGAVFVVLGLSIWICGLGLRKILISLAGLAGGFIVGLYVVGRNLFSASLSGALAALISLILEKILFVILAAAFAAAITFVIVAEPYYEQNQGDEVMSEEPQQPAEIELRDIPYELKDFGLDAGAKIKRVGTNLPMQRWAIVAAPAVVFLICGVVLWRFTIALFFSVLGTMIVFLGMILVLTFRGTEPISHIRSNPLISGVIFLAMIGFGTVIQLLLCKKSKKQKIPTIKPSGKKGSSAEGSEKIVEHDWRSA